MPAFIKSVENVRVYCEILSTLRALFKCNSNVRERAKCRRFNTLHTQGTWPDTKGHGRGPETRY